MGDFDKRPTSPDGVETLVVEAVSADTELGILVDSWAGTGPLEIAVEEQGK